MSDKEFREKFFEIWDWFSRERRMNVMDGSKVRVKDFLLALEDLTGEFKDENSSND